LGRIKIIIKDNMKDSWNEYKYRYRVELSLNIWCDNDKEAGRVALDICNKERNKYDNKCQIIKICESPFGRFKERELKLY
tara:strand:- start:257 stop:496 length:240 start_codon:yes stop_codon:yes gene_type:complete